MPGIPAPVRSGRAGAVAPRHRPFPHWRRLSLRARLTAAATLVAALGLSLAAVLLLISQRGSLMHGLDGSARQRALIIATALDKGRPVQPLPASGAGDDVAQVVDSRGRVVAASENVAGEHALFHVRPAAPDSEPSVYSVRGVPLGDNDTYRVAALSAGPADARKTVYVGLPTAPVDHAVHTLTAELAVGLPTLTALLAAAGWHITGRALGPVERLRRQAAEITTTDLHRRLDLPPNTDEVRRLGETLNDLLKRLDEATARQRQFVADAAHELRSPVAAVRAELETAARHPRADLSARIPGMLEETVRLGALVDDLVHLARLDTRGALRETEVDLDDLVEAEVRRPHARPEVSVACGRIQPARIRGDPDALSRAVRNLLDNAVRHAHRRVEVTLAATDSEAVLCVRDDGPGIPPADRERVFDRFTRLDDARSRDAGGSGLGLAIVREIVTRHGGRASVEDGGPGARLVLRLPVSPPGGRPDDRPGRSVRRYTPPAGRRPRRGRGCAGPGGSSGPG
ncbi:MULTISPECIES: HAMP domain-containing sensor histidine kinase [Streptomyces]|uniref:histidine kinase n=1 Tax=Streptomyces lonegramiae TaxID=3075524 RepID=A0ABU2XGL2_9ACTN|nr:HAMP domain-containing sensor histidine kinase [Streptomyces sp. DSM 41529]MDT0545064.1 HAMP domain-containing sensor histidine kinase [Streptomyces sp. DSM 41529]